MLHELVAMERKSFRIASNLQSTATFRLFKGRGENREALPMRAVK
jgi:hypothetical protein